MKPLTRHILLWFLIVGGSLVQSVYSQPTGLPFLKMGVGAHAQSMGGAYIAQAQDASAVYWNPSALSGLAGSEVLLYRSQLISDFSYNYLAYGHPFKNRRAAFGVGFGQLSKGMYDGRDERGRPTEQFEASDRVMAISYGRKIGKVVSAGFGVKLIQSKVGSFASTGWGMDFSGSYQASKKTRLAAGIYNLGPSMRFVSESFNIPSALSAGISHRLLNALTISADSRYGIHDRKFQLSFGGEFDLSGVALRMGYMSQLASNHVKLGSQSQSFDQLSGLGMGVGLKLFSRTRLDYAFIPMGELGGAHHVNLVWKFN